jgi:CRP-like cAMP-binding protein
MPADPPEAADEEEAGPAAHTDPPSGPAPSSSMALSFRHGSTRFNFTIARYRTDPVLDGDRGVATYPIPPAAPGGDVRGRGWRPRLRPAHKRQAGHFHASLPPPETPETPDQPGEPEPSHPRRRRPGPPVSFWDVLSPAERSEFSSQAHKRTFASGARLMREGETADNVVVILAGRTKICVDGNGQERTIAYRGPGQLLGERAALQVSVRSATVVALDTVHALAMHTEDFAAFLSAHPAVLDIVESQVYFRLTEEPTQASAGDGLPAEESGLAAAGRAVTRAPTSPQPLTGHNCTVIFTDVVSFGSPERDDSDRVLIRHELMAMTSAALKAIWAECFWDDRGDGLLVIVPSTVPTAKVLEFLLVALPIALKRHNGSCGAGTRFKLRAALDVGAVTSDDIGVSGQVIINAARLLDASALKRAISGSGAPLGLIVSDFVYYNTVRHARHVTDPAAYRRVRVRVKEASLPAWISLVGSPLQAPPQWMALLAAG